MLTASPGYVDTINVFSERAMYHAIVKRIARKNFERVSEKNFDALLSDCAPNIHHRFGGNHARWAASATTARLSVNGLAALAALASTSS
jgi:hypothetical protein